MTVLAILLSMLAGACWLAALTHLTAGLRHSLDRTQLAFAWLAFFAGLYSLATLHLHHATDAASYVPALKWAVSAACLLLAGLPWFARYYTGAGGRLIPAAITLLYFAIAVVNMRLPLGLALIEQPNLIRMELPWGELATIHDRKQRSPLVLIYWTAHVCTFAYLYYTCLVQHRRGQRKRALAFAAATSVLLAALVANIVLPAVGVNSLHGAPYSFGALILLMMFWLSSEERFRALVRQAGDGIFLADQTGRYLDVNEAGCTMLGYTREELCKMRVFDVVTPEEVANVEHEKASLLRGLTVRREFQFQRKDGSIFTGELSGRLLSDGCLLGVVRDMTEKQQLLRSLEERVAARTAEYAELNRQLESFSYSVSHDLRAPVRAITSFASLLLEQHGGALDEAMGKHLRRIQSAASHMNDLIEGLLQLAQVSHQSVKDDRVNLSQFAEEEIERLRERDPMRRVSMVCAPAITSRGDARLLRILMNNLIDNAWKYTSATPAARIEFGVDSTHGGAVFFVRDNGAGFDMQFSEQLFRPFHRLHSAAQFSGAGVGLATAARVVERHGGTIWAHAAPGEGATFYFTLDRRIEPQTVGRTDSEIELGSV